MNLHNLVSPFVSAINPSVPVTLSLSDGTYTTNPDFSKTPNYTVVTGVMAQIQSLTYKDLKQIEGLNIQGSARAIYLTGDVEGVVRVLNKGGDLITFQDGTVWLVNMVLENWNPPDNSQSGWVKCACVLQDGS
jgi:hypothetical protein